MSGLDQSSKTVALYLTLRQWVVVLTMLLSTGGGILP
jgi:hypothetical protein